MKSKRDVKWVRMSAAEVRPPSAGDLRRLKRASAGAIDTSDIPEQRSMKKHGPIWSAIVGEMIRQGLTGHGLWKKAREFCPKIPESAVYEFLKDKRSVRVEYADAMLQALGVKLTVERRKQAG